MTRFRNGLLILTAAVVCAAGALAWQLLNPPPADRAPRIGSDGLYVSGTLPGDEAPLKASVEGLRRALSFDYRKLNDNVDAATQLMTGKFGEEFRSTFDKSVRKLALQRKGVTTAIVRGAGLVELKGNSATTLVFVDQTLVSTGKTSAAPVTVSQNRVIVTLVRSGKSWRISGIQPF